MAWVTALQWLLCWVLPLQWLLCYDFNLILTLDRGWPSRKVTFPATRRSFTRFASLGKGHLALSTSASID